MNAEILILGATRYDFDGNKGVSLNYLINQNNKSSDSVGFKPSKQVIDFHLFEKLQNLEFPCFANIQYELKQKGSDTVLHIVDIINAEKSLKLFV